MTDGGRGWKRGKGRQIFTCFVGFLQGKGMTGYKMNKVGRDHGENANLKNVIC